MSQNSHRSGGVSPQNIKNLAFLPVDVTLLQAFVIDTIVKPQKDTYPLFAFLKDALATLAMSALNGKNAYNEQASQFADVSLASTLITLGDAGVVNDPLIPYIFEGVGSVLYSQAIFDRLESFSEHYINFININIFR